MNRTKLKNYAPLARREFIQAMTDRAALYGLTADKIEPVVEKGDVAVIGGRSYPREVAKKRKAVEDRIKRHGFEQTMEALAYTWFNRLVAIRFMELHGYLEHGYRVLSHPEGKPTPEILEHAEHVDLPGLKKETVIDLKLVGNKESELYRLLLTAQCNSLNAAMPFLFEKIEDETELLLPDNLLHSDSLIRKLVGEIDEADWQEVEIIGWLYQFYISEKKDEVIGKVVASEDIPAATQLFTPNWIVKYLVQNTLGRQWLATYPQSALRQQMQYYIEPAEQTPEVQEQLKAITPTSLNPEELTLLDPACGSGHILVEAYDLFKAIYQERGYRAKDIPALILQKNLFGLEIDDRAAQLAAFALMMKARADDRRIFDSEAKPNVLAFQDSQGMNAADITHALNSPILKEKLPPSEYLIEEIEDAENPLFSKKVLAEKGHVSQGDIGSLLALFENAKTFGSLIQVPPTLAAKLPEIEQRLNDVLKFGDLSHATAHVIKPLLQQARFLAGQYDVSVMNPPYMHTKTMPLQLKGFASNNYPASKTDLFSMFIERGFAFLAQRGRSAMITMQNWMFLSAYTSLRDCLLTTVAFETLAHFGPRAFAEITGEVVQTVAFVAVRLPLGQIRPTFFRLTDGDAENKSQTLLRRQNCFDRLIQDDFRRIPGMPIAYWITPTSLRVLSTEQPLGAVAEIKSGMSTSDNDKFLRYWHEVDHGSIEFRAHDLHSAKESKKTWFPFNKGGGFRKWFGNHEYVVNWKDDGKEIKEAVVNNPTDPGTTHWSRRIYNTEYFFRPCLSWSVIAGDKVAFRLSPPGHISSHKGPGVFSHDKRLLNKILAILNSPVSEYFLGLIRQSLGIEVGHVARIPFIDVNVSVSDVECLAEGYKRDWDANETSWDFVRNPFLSFSKPSKVSESWFRWAQDIEQRRDSLNDIEKRLNLTIADGYGMTDCLENVPSCTESTVAPPNREEDIKRLLSYAIGCMMGRFSLDKPGLVYANSDNQGFDPSQYKSFKADDDGIIPLLETDWGVRDDAANRLVEFVGVAWSEDHLEENLKFIADSLGPNNGEQPRDTIRRYLATGFYKYHLSMYKKRPIYWLFSSGKQRAFQCLVYLHRYHDGTLARMRTEYVIPLQAQIAARIEQLEGDKTKATSTSHRNKLQKEQTDLKKREAELRTFEEKLKHAADQKISLDLDDGVKVNYAKFGDLLAETKAVTGGKDDE